MCSLRPSYRDLHPSAPGCVRQRGYEQADGAEGVGLPMLWSLVLLIAAPLLAGLGNLLVSDRRVVEALQYGQSVILLAAGANVVAGVGTGERATVGRLLYTDALSASLDLVLAVC